MNVLPFLMVFHGLDHEDPEIFFKLLETRFSEKAMKPDNNWKIKSLKAHCLPLASDLIEEVEAAIPVTEASPTKTYATIKAGFLARLNTSACREHQCNVYIRM